MRINESAIEKDKKGGREEGLRRDQSSSSGKSIGE